MSEPSPWDELNAINDHLYVRVEARIKTCPICWRNGTGAALVPPYTYGFCEPCQQRWLVGQDVLVVNRAHLDAVFNRLGVMSTDAREAHEIEAIGEAMRELASFEQILPEDSMKREALVQFETNSAGPDPLAIFSTKDFPNFWGHLSESVRRSMFAIVVAYLRTFPFEVDHAGRFKIVEKANAFWSCERDTPVTVDLTVQDVLSVNGFHGPVLAIVDLFQRMLSARQRRASLVEALKALDAIEHAFSAPAVTSSR